MVIRIVKLGIREDKVESFRSTFRENRHLISTFPGCQEVRLVFDLNESGIHFTISIWNSEEDIERYRNSALFTKIWSTVKPWFSTKPEAWSTQEF
jgi:heme-degrading monooxygenase HmoA